MRLVLCALVGIAAGVGGAVWSVRAGALGADARIGPWTTGHDFGTARASRYARAVIALRGLLALPAHEARYYNAAIDDAGEPLLGARCYRVHGGTLPARWWSLTLYDTKGYLIPNAAGTYSIGSAGLSGAEARDWSLTISPVRAGARWLPTGGVPRFELTLRAYLPEGDGEADFSREQLPHIEHVPCA